MSAPDRPLISLDAKFYIGTAGSTAATLVDTVGDVELDTKKGEAKTNRRGVKYSLVRGTMIDMSVKFSVADNPLDTKLAQLVAAYLAGTPLAFCLLDRTSGEGPDFDGEIMEMKRSEKLEDGIGYDFTVKPTWAGRSPSWKTASD